MPARAARNTAFMLVLAAGLASCMLSPHMEHLRPAVSGTLLDGGKPVPGVELYLGKYPGNNQPCTEVGEAVPVSPAGAFGWAAIERYKLMDGLLNPVDRRGAITALCIRHPERGVMIGIMLHIRQHQSMRLRLDCDIAQAQGNTLEVRPATMSPWVGQHYYCKSSLAD